MLFHAQQLIRFTKSATKVCFSRYLLVTNTTITVISSGIGDMLAQKYEIFRGNQNEWDFVRSRHICTTGLVIGPLCHYWYHMLEFMLPGYAWRAIAQKVLVDQIVFSPVNISTFLVMMGVLQGDRREAIKHEMKMDFPTLLKAEWLVWPPAQLVNFTFMPLHYRVLFDNTVSLGFDFYYSFIKFQKDKTGNNKSETMEFDKMDTCSWKPPRPRLAEKPEDIWAMLYHSFLNRLFTSYDEAFDIYHELKHHRRCTETKPHRHCSTQIKPAVDMTSQSLNIREDSNDVS